MTAPRRGFFSGLAEGFRRNVEFFDKGAKVADKIGVWEENLAAGMCGRCGEVPPTVAIGESRPVLCASCAALGAHGLGQAARHAAEQSGALEPSNPVGALLRGFLGGTGRKE